MQVKLWEVNVWMTYFLNGTDKYCRWLYWLLAIIRFIVDNQGFSIQKGQRPKHIFSHYSEAMCNIMWSDSNADKTKCSECLNTEGRLVSAVLNVCGKLSSR